MSDFFTIPILVAILICIAAIILILQPQNLPTNSVEQKKIHHQFRSSKHKWQKSQVKSFYFCYLCQKLISSWFSNDLLQCKKCGIVIHALCKYLKLKKPQCKYIIVKQSQTGQNVFYHQWRQCSYNTSTTCSICQEFCVGVQTYVCIWCFRVKHGSCNGMNQPCDFGKLRKFILQPTQITCNSPYFPILAFRNIHKQKRKKRQKTSDDSQNQKIQQIQFKLRDKTKRPIIVLINKKSGGQNGNQFIKAFYQSLNPLQVISILDQGLQKLKVFVKLPKIIILIAGGDGTVCSVINYMKTIPQWSENNPPAAILPLGTGNDLSRSLGWGFSVDFINPQSLILDINKKGRQQLLDRWRLTIQSEQQQKQLTLYNYLGIGLDGKICKQFHQTRQKYPGLFFSQFSNKIIYTQIGVADLFKQSKIPLCKLIQIKVNGQIINIQDVENVILMNIYHWGGGVTNLWQATKPFVKQSYSDGIMQVIGFTDVIHMGKVQIGMQSPIQLGQGSQIQINSLKPNVTIPIQMDGQPLQLMSPVKIKCTKKDQVNVLATNITQQSHVLQVLHQGIKENIINQNQFQNLINISHKINRQCDKDIL